MNKGAQTDWPNDRRHQVKLYSAYAVTEGLTLGANLQFWTGRPINAFGYHPTDLFAQAYDSESFFAGGEPAPRGSRGRTSSYYSIDVSASYNIDIGEDQKLVARAEIFNLLNSSGIPYKFNQNWTFLGFRIKLNEKLNINSGFQKNTIFKSSEKYLKNRLWNTTLFYKF